MSSTFESASSSSSRVRVAIRVRPLSNSEVQKGHKCILEEADSNGLIVWDPTSLYASTNLDLSIMDAKCWTRPFAFDYCLWSMDSGRPNYSSQADVFLAVGQPVVQWALDGFNTCVFAYGQTGAGKSYTMIGNNSDPSEFGLIPSDCLSFTNSKNVKIREHPTEGIYVANLTTVKVNSFEDILSLITIGNKTRSVASTRSNAASSRSHAIVTLTLRQWFRNVDVSKSGSNSMKHKISRINLVDLAGSERVTNTGSVGVRLREANNINQSLSVLGDVIKCLGNAKRREGHIPYRNSALTMVLKDSLGGNSQTVMVAAVSPSSADYDETISTLKYADNAKKVRMQVAVNVTSGLLNGESEAKQLVPVLQAEVNKLRELLIRQQEANLLSPPLELVEEMRIRVMQLEEQLADRENLINSLQLQSSRESPLVNVSKSSFHHVVSNGSLSDEDSPMSYNSSGRQVRSQPLVVLADDAIDISLPRVINLNQDPLFSECLVYYVPTGLAVAGKSESEVDILLSGPDILPRHCILYNDNVNVWICPTSYDSKVYVNGKLLIMNENSAANSGFRLKHYDRVAMGKYHLFRFEEKGKSRAVSPGKTLSRTSNTTDNGFSEDAPGWDFAHDELMYNKELTLPLENFSEFKVNKFNNKSLSRRYDSFESSKDLYCSIDTDNLSDNKSGSDVVSNQQTYGHNSSNSNKLGSNGANLEQDAIWSNIDRAMDGSSEPSADEMRDMMKLIIETTEQQIGNNQNSSHASKGTSKTSFVYQNNLLSSLESAENILSTPVAVKKSANVPPTSGKSKHSDADDAFEREASLLQADLIQMQQNLQEKMKRYGASAK